MTDNSTSPSPPPTAPLRLGVLISGGGRTLLNVLDEINAGRLDAEVAVVIASKNCSGIERCLNVGLDVKLVEYASFRDASGRVDVEAYTAALLDVLDAAKVDLIAMMGFLSRWNIPSRYDGRVMNIHPALLPNFGGQGMFGHHVHEAVLAQGGKVSGCTVHFADNEYDTGPIVVQRTVPVFDTDTPDTLAARVFEQECLAYPEAIRLFAAGRLEILGPRVRIRPVQ
jgi:phosphoribosylglycinamide formyltransferase-1